MFAEHRGLPASLVVGDPGVLARTIDKLGLKVEIHIASSPEEAQCGPRRIDVIQPAESLPEDLPIGRIDARSGRAAFESVRHAIELARAGRVRAIATAPINKEAMRAAGYNYPGHTEILAELGGASGEVAMMLMNDELRVVLVTIHIALRDVMDAITPRRELETIRLANEAVIRLGVARPRIAVAGLNPHGSENGLFGREDIDIIVPAISQAGEEGIDASGPWPGDTIFMRARQGQFDAVVAQYHDQGLIPIKYLGIDRGVNITLGLPFVRTSVDHGTAFDIAGRGVADPSSLREAVIQAAALSSG
jgi:4-hydroxythreonine-4-phosphate dehydrogenase